jgi:hypothetical protein
VESSLLQPGAYETWWQWGLIAVLALLTLVVLGYFQPVLIDGVEYVDGGAHSPTNLDVLAVLGLNAMDGSRWQEIVERAQGTAAERLGDEARRRLLLG